MADRAPHEGIGCHLLDAVAHTDGVPDQARLVLVQVS